MQALKAPGYLSGNVRLSTHVKGKPRKGGPVWEARFRLPNGTDSTKTIGPAWTKRGRPPEGSHTRATAEAWLREFLGRDEHALPRPEAVMFETVTFAFVADCEARIAAGNLRQTTFRTYRNVAVGPPLTADGRRRKHSREHPAVVPLVVLWRDRPLDSISEPDVEEYREGLIERGLAPSTLNQHRAVVRGIFALAVKRFGATSNPGLAFEWAKARRTKSDPISFYRPHEVRALARAAAGDHDAAIFIVVAFTGLRLSELRALRWRSVDFDDVLIHVERGYTDDGGEDLPKSYRVRSVPMMPQVAAALNSLRRRRHFTDADDFVFVNSVGGPVDGGALYRRFIKAAADAELRRLRFHDLRHSFGTMAVRRFPITDVQTWMGHADIATTRKYVHYAPQRDAAAQLGELAGDDFGAGLRLVPAAA